jgi:hypothetical protein
LPSAGSEFRNNVKWCFDHALAGFGQLFMKPIPAAMLFGAAYVGMHFVDFVF